MKKAALILFVPILLARAEVRPMTLGEALARAIKQNPELILARLDLLKSQFAVKISKDPFVPKVYGGSGAAWTTGYPASINGQPPSIFEARTDMSVFNRQQSYGVAQARENARGAEIDVSRSQDEAVYRTASLYLDALQTMQALDVARKQIGSFEKVQDNVRARVAEGRELEIQNKRAALNAARARQRVEALEADLETVERNLAVVLGFPADDRVRAASGDGPLLSGLPENEEAAAEQAIENSKELRVLTSRMQAKNLEIKGYRAARWPQVGLVAQYNLLAKYNYQDFFGNHFQSNNGQLGAAVTIPLLVGSAPKAYIGMDEAELARLRAQMDQVRNRITLDTRKSFLQLQRAETARDVARLDLDVAREQLSVLLAQHDEGRATLADVEQARVQENEKWMAYYDTQHQLERVKLELLHQTGTLAALLE
jgi:outer membrane protein